MKTVSYTLLFTLLVAALIISAIWYTQTTDFNPAPIETQSPTPTPTPWDQQTFVGIPLTYIYVAIIAILIGLIVVTGSVYIRNMKTGKASRN